MVHVPEGKDGEVLNLARQMATQGKNDEIRASGKMYVSASIMGSFWDSATVDLLKPGQSMPIFAGDREIGEVKRSEGGYLEAVYFTDSGGNIPVVEGESKRFNKAADVAVALYGHLARGRERGMW